MLRRSRAELVAVTMHGYSSHHFLRRPRDALSAGAGAGLVAVAAGRPPGQAHALAPRGAPAAAPRPALAAPAVRTLLISA